MEDYYEMIGTSANSIKYMRLGLIGSKEYTEQEIDEYMDKFIEERYERAASLIQRKKMPYEKELLKLKTSLSKIEWLENQENRILELEQFLQEVQDMETMQEYKSLEVEYSRQKRLYQKEYFGLTQLDRQVRQNKEECKNMILEYENIILGIEEEQNQLANVYEQIKSQELRDLYEQSVNEKLKREQGNRKIINFEKFCNRKNTITATAYSILHISERELRTGNEEEIDQKIEMKKEELINMWTERIEKAKGDKSKNFFKTKIRIESIIQEIQNAYELINTAAKREQYLTKLEEQKREMEEERRERKIENKYSHAEEYNPGLIASSKKSEQQILWNKMVRRLDKNGNEYIYEDEEGREIRIKKTGEVIYVNGGGGKISVDEYEITRIIDGEEIKDIIYTDTIKHILLSRDKETGMPIDPKYYNCVVNELLSEEAIEGSKYNGGYIGKICKDKEGNYQITLGDENLSTTEQENLTAVMIMQKINEIKSANYEEKGVQK